MDAAREVNTATWTHAEYMAQRKLSAAIDALDAGEEEGRSALPERPATGAALRLWLDAQATEGKEE